MAAGFTKKNLLVDMFAVGLTPAKPDCGRFVEAWIDNRFRDTNIDPNVKKNFVKNFTSVTRNKWKKCSSNKAQILADKYYEAVIVFNSPKPKPEPTVAAEPTQAGKLLFLLFKFLFLHFCTI